MEILTEILTEITSPLKSKGVWGGGTYVGGKEKEEKVEKIKIFL